jgi:hypothetical protein
VGDVIKWLDGHYCTMDKLPEQGRYEQEYSDPTIAIWVTELDADMAPAGPSVKQLHEPDAILDVRTPRPGE